MVEGKPRRSVFPTGGMTSSMIEPGSGISSDPGHKLKPKKTLTLKDFEKISPIKEEESEDGPLKGSHQINNKKGIELVSIKSTTNNDSVSPHISSNPMAQAMIDSDHDSGSQSTDSEQQMEDLEKNVADINRLVNQIETGEGYLGGLEFNIPEMIANFGKRELKWNEKHRTEKNLALFFGHQNWNMIMMLSLAFREGLRM